MSRQLAGLRVALVHDWLVTLRGGERVLDALCELFPDAVVHTLVRKPGIGTPRIEAMRHATSFVDRVPFAHRKHRWLLPLYPSAIEAFDLQGFDLVISSSHCVAKGVIAGPGAVHVCYCHTPVRYAWDRTDDYVTGSHPALKLARPLLGAAARWLRDWDLRTVPRVDAFVANSHNTAGKIRAFYGREATVVAPPVECERFAHVQPRGAYDLVLGGLVPYKRVDLAVAAWRALPERRLVIVGDGPERERLQRQAPANVEFVGRVEEDALADWYAGARCLVFPGEEDFGIVPLEAQSAGVPVLAYGRGGALESVVDGKTGVFFHLPTPEALAEAVQKLDRAGISADDCRRHARTFDRSAFLAQMTAAVESAVAAGAHGARARNGEP
jgi:glycosyltransferase involved in cell wall biosynthesis